MGATGFSTVILSTGRTGTMFFADLLKTLLPNVDVYHEAGERSRLINIFMHAYLSGLLPRNVPIWAWQQAIAPNLYHRMNPNYIDSNNHIYTFVPEFPELYSNLKVIHIVRDPRTYVSSHINWARHRPKSFIANHIVPFWQPNAYLLKQMPFKEWILLTPLERFAWIWDFKNNFIKQLENSGIPYLLVRFEDFFGGNDPEKYLNQIFSFLNLPKVSKTNSFFQQPVNPGVKKTFPSWHNWTAIQCNKFQIICGATMASYGYGHEGEWKKLVSVH